MKCDIGLLRAIFSRMIVNLIFRLWFRSLWHGVPGVEQVRRRFMAADWLSALGRKRVALRYREFGGVAIEWIGQDEGASKGVILYLHGGGFAVRAALTDRRFCQELCRRSGLPVLLVPYRLAPEYPFPHGVDDCCQVYEGLIDSGIAAERIVIIGHSAGANYAMVLLMRMRGKGRPQPAAAVSLSVPIDMTANHSSIIVNIERDVMQGPNIWQWVRKNYVGAWPEDHPEISPIFGDWSGLCQLSFHVSDSEMLLNDSRRAVARARLAGNRAQLMEWRNVPHNFYFLPFLDEAKMFLEMLSDYLDEVLPRDNSVRAASRT